MSAALAWLGIWSLATGWLLLVDFFLSPNDWGWVFAGAGTLLLILSARRVRWPRADRWLYLAAIPLALATLLWPLPHRAAGAGMICPCPGNRPTWASTPGGCPCLSPFLPFFHKTDEPGV